MECTPLKSYQCSICNKSYSSRQSLWNHNTKFHTTEILKPTSETSETSVLPSYAPQNTSKLVQYTCKYCNKIYSRKDNLNRHTKTCKSKNIDNKLKVENIKLKD